MLIADFCTVHLLMSAGADAVVLVYGVRTSSQVRAVCCHHKGAAGASLALSGQRGAWVGEPCQLSRIVRGCAYAGQIYSIFYDYNLFSCVTYVLAVCNFRQSAICCLLVLYTRERATRTPAVLLSPSVAGSATRGLSAADIIQVRAVVLHANRGVPTER